MGPQSRFNFTDFLPAEGVQAIVGKVCAPDPLNLDRFAFFADAYLMTEGDVCVLAMCQFPLGVRL